METWHRWWQFWHRLQGGRTSPSVTPLQLIFPSFLQLFFSLHISYETHWSSSEFPALEQCVLKLGSRECQYKWNLCCSFYRAGTTLHGSDRYFFFKKATIKVSHLVSFQWKGFESGKNTKQLIIICCSESLVCEFCFLLPVSTEHTRPKRNIRSTWNSVPNLQTSYHDCTCKLVR